MMLAPEFNTAAELTLHYINVRKRTRRWRINPPCAKALALPARVAIVEQPKPAEFKKQFEAQSRVMCADILRAVAFVTGVPVHHIASLRRQPYIVYSRQLYCWLAKDMTGASFPFIGRIIGRDHTTVLHSCRKVEKKLADYQSKIDAIKGLLHQCFENPVIVGDNSTLQNRQYTDSDMVAA